MTAQDLIELARKMRQAQKKYFKGHRLTDLIAAKKQEIDFDLALAHYDRYRENTPKEK